MTSSDLSSIDYADERALQDKEFKSGQCQKNTLSVQIKFCFWLKNVSTHHPHWFTTWQQQLLPAKLTLEEFRNEVNGDCSTTECYPLDSLVQPKILEEMLGYPLNRGVFSVAELIYLLVLVPNTPTSDSTNWQQGVKLKFASSSSYGHRIAIES